MSSKAVFVPDEQHVWLTADVLKEEKGVVEVLITDPDSSHYQRLLNFSAFFQNLKALPLQVLDDLK